MGRDGPIRVAVIGGGCASIATAFELTRREHEGKYKVTVYQQGWRLGGKGASGRGPPPNLVQSFLTCHFTVSSLILRMLAMRLLAKPSA
jgi:uncharacterized protein with NAD-binding domain and iron-sulfur cluster